MSSHDVRAAQSEGFLQNIIKQKSAENAIWHQEVQQKTAKLQELKSRKAHLDSEYNRLCSDKNIVELFEREAALKQ